MPKIYRAMGVLGLSLLGGCTAQSGQTAATPTEAIATTSAPTATQTSTPAANGDEMTQRIESWVKASNPDMGPLMIRWGEADLDGDGAQEVLVYVGGPMVCGSGGCNLNVLKVKPDGFDRIGAILVSQLPVGILDTSSHGMRDLAITTYGGGAPEQIMRVPFDGTKYASNPTVKPATPVDTIGTEVIAVGPLEKLD